MTPTRDTRENGGTGGIRGTRETGGTGGTRESGGRNAVLRRLLPSLVLNAALPLLVYLLLSPRIGDVPALAVGAAIPVVVTAVGFARRRRVDPIGVVAVVTFAIVLVVLALTGGNPLVLKLHDAVVTGPLGLVCLVSVAIRRPLLMVVNRMMSSRGHNTPSTLTAAAQRRTQSVLTALIGTILVVHAALILTLALTLPTTTFLAVGRPVGWVVIAVGVLTIMTYRNRLKRARGTGTAR